MKQLVFNIFILPIKPIMFIFWIIITILILINSNIEDLAMADKDNFINPELEAKLEKLFNAAEPFVFAFCAISWFYIGKFLFLNFL
jgi:hypothetical protein